MSSDTQNNYSFIDGNKFQSPNFESQNTFEHIGSNTFQNSQPTNFSKEIVEINYYKIIGVDQNASTDEISKKCKMLLKDYHPDKTGSNDPKLLAMYELVTEARSILTDEMKRKGYDYQLQHSRPVSFAENKKDFNDFIASQATKESISEVEYARIEAEFKNNLSKIKEKGADLADKLTEKESAEMLERLTLKRDLDELENVPEERFVIDSNDKEKKIDLKAFNAYFDAYKAANSSQSTTSIKPYTDTFTIQPMFQPASSRFQNLTDIDKHHSSIDSFFGLPVNYNELDNNPPQVIPQQSFSNDPEELDKAYKKRLEEYKNISTCTPDLLAGDQAIKDLLKDPYSISGNYGFLVGDDTCNFPTSIKVNNKTSQSSKIDAYNELIFKHLNS